MQMVRCLLCGKHIDLKKDRFEHIGRDYVICDDCRYLIEAEPYIAVKELIDKLIECKERGRRHD